MEVSTAISSPQATNNNSNNVQLVELANNKEQDEQLQSLAQNQKLISNNNNFYKPTTNNITATATAAAATATATAAAENGSPIKQSNNNNNSNHDNHHSQPVTTVPISTHDMNDTDSDITKSDIDFVIDQLLKRTENFSAQQNHESIQNYDCTTQNQTDQSVRDINESIEREPETKKEHNNAEPHIETPSIDVSQQLTTVQVGVIVADEPEETKEMAILKNLEFSPTPTAISTPPILTANEETAKSSELDQLAEEQKKSIPCETSAKRKRKQPREETQTTSEEPKTGGRAKRQRTQTKLFQAGDSKPSLSESYAPSPDSLLSEKSFKSAKKLPKTNRKKSIPSSDRSSNAQDTVQYQQQSLYTNDLPSDVIFYEKNDYLAVRNEENSFFLCQLTECVKVIRPFIKVRWFDTNNDGKTYYLTDQYDSVPQQSILMPIKLNKEKKEKRGEQFYTLDDQEKENILERLKRSLSIAPQVISSQESSTTVEN